jgi:hypothetical protein
LGHKRETYKVYENGKLRAITKSEDEAFFWLQHNQPFSFFYALKYGGFKIKKVK